MRRAAAERETTSRRRSITGRLLAVGSVATGAVAFGVAAEPGDPASAALLPHIRVLDATLHDIASFEDGLAFATTRDDSPVSPGTVVSIDTRAAEITGSVDVGDQPNVLDLQGGFLYVGLNGPGDVALLTTPELDLEYTIDLGEDAGAQRIATDVAAFPGGAETIVVATAVPGRDEPHAGVVTADFDGVYPVQTPAGPGPDRIEFLDNGSDFYGFDSQGEARTLTEMTFTTGGIEIVDTVQDLISGSGVDLFGSNGLLYTSTGAIIDVRADPPVVTDFPLETGRTRGRGGVSVNGGAIYLVETEAEGDRHVLAQYGAALSSNPLEEVGRWELGAEITDPRAVHDLQFGFVAVIDADGTTVIVDTSQVPVPPLPDDLGSLGEFVPLSPTRFLDTRTGVGRGGVIERLGELSTIDVQIAGRLGVPPHGVDAVVVNVTAVDPSQRSYLTVFPDGTLQPVVANLNMVPGQNRANLATVPVGQNGRITVFNRFGDVDVVFDVAGYYSGVDGPSGARYRPIAPTRIMDTRDGTGGVPVGRLGAFDSRVLPVRGVGSVPSSGVQAIVANLTVVGPTEPTFVVAFPHGEARPLAANVNAPTGANTGNQIVVKVPIGGAIEFFNRAGSVDVVVDLVGYYEDVPASDDTDRGRVIAVTPFRVVDTRNDEIFDDDRRLDAGDTLFLLFRTDALAGLVANVTATGTQGAGNVRAYPYPGAQPLASTVNYGDAQTVPNHAMAPIGQHLAFQNNQGRTHLVIDVFAVILRR